MTDKKAPSPRKRITKPEKPVSAPVEKESGEMAPPVSSVDTTKNSQPEMPSKPRGNPGPGSRFIPGGNSQGGWNGNRKASWNPNLAVSRGHPNGAARTSR